MVKNIHSIVRRFFKDTQTVPLEQLSDKIVGCSKISYNSKNNIIKEYMLVSPFYIVNNVELNVTREIKKSLVNAKAFSRQSLRTGDILISKRITNKINIGIVPHSSYTLIGNNSMLVIRLKDEYVNYAVFLIDFLNNRDILEYFKNSSTNKDRKLIELDILKMLPVPVLTDMELIGYCEWSNMSKNTILSDKIKIKRLQEKIATTQQALNNCYEYFEEIA